MAFSLSNVSFNTYILNQTNQTYLTTDNHVTICSQSLLQCVVLSISFSLLIIFSVIGNSFVIAAVILERNLQMSVANYLIVSLASADLTVSIMVMPIAAYTEISLKWNLGSLVCDIWTSFDVLCCTASILHLVAIALDRYWAITNVEYASKRTVQRIVTMIVIIWSISTVVGISPHIFGLSSSRSDKSDLCRLTDNLTFQLASTFAAFYLPLIVMCVIYWKIFQSAKFRIRKKVFNKHHHNNNNNNYNSKAKKSNKKCVSFKLKNKTSRQPNQNPEIIENNIELELNETDNKPKQSENSIKTENNIICFHPKTNEIQTSVFNKDLNKIKNEIGNKKRFKSEKLKQIKKILNQADETNKSLEMLKTIQIDSNHLNLLTETDITKIKLSDSDNLISSCLNELKKEKSPNDDISINTNLISELKPSVNTTDNRISLIIQENNQQQQQQQRITNVTTLIKKRAKIDIKRERKAARVLGIIMSCFIICWLPYFCMQIFIAICKDCYFSLLLEQYHIGTILTWSGYLNSLLNPIIYTIFSPDFRHSFAKILFGKYARKNRFKI